MDVPAWKRGLRLLQFMKQSIPVAVHSIVVQTPTGTARTHRFATKTVELPAQEGDRVTISLAAPSNVYCEVGPLRFNAKAPGYNPREPMCLTNHVDGRESGLIREPLKNGDMSILNPSFLFPTLVVLASGDAASGIIDPVLPQLIPIAAIASVALGTTINSLVLPQLNQLPSRMVDVVAIKQKLLSQYDLLQTRIMNLKDAAEKEVWMLARLYQLEIKILAVGEPSYRCSISERVSLGVMVRLPHCDPKVTGLSHGNSLFACEGARRSRVIKAHEKLESSPVAHIELINSYARISSMIEIEVEMDSDLLAAEAASNAENIAEQIEQTMELENLEQRWKIQAEANDEVERLLSSQPMPTEQV